MITMEEEQLEQQKTGVVLREIDILATAQEALRAYANPKNWDGNTWMGEGSGGCWNRDPETKQDHIDLTPHPFMLAQEALK